MTKIGFDPPPPPHTHNSVFDLPNQNLIYEHAPDVDVTNVIACVPDLVLVPLVPGPAHPCADLSRHAEELAHAQLPVSFLLLNHGRYIGYLLRKRCVHVK